MWVPLATRAAVVALRIAVLLQPLLGLIPRVTTVAFIEPAVERCHVVVGHVLRIRRIVGRLAGMAVGNLVGMFRIALPALVLICRHNQIVLKKSANNLPSFAHLFLIISIRKTHTCAKRWKAFLNRGAQGESALILYDFFLMDVAIHFLQTFSRLRSK